MRADEPNPHDKWGSIVMNRQPDVKGRVPDRSSFFENVAEWAKAFPQPYRRMQFLAFRWQFWDGQ